MRRPISIVMILALLLLAASACSKWPSDSLTGDERTAAAYVKSRGYKILSNLGPYPDYILTKANIVQLPYKQMWAVQREEPDQYFGHTITSYEFVVTNHPFEKKFGGRYATQEYEIRVDVMLSEGRVVGGYSYPARTDGTIMAGGVYAFDGETLEELTGLTYGKWLDMWTKKYGE